MTTRRYVILLVALSLGMAWLYGEIDYRVAFADVDLRHYRVMADAAPGIDHTIPRPFAHRPLGPWLAGLLPLPDPQAFRLISWTLLISSTLFLFGVLRSLRINDGPACFAAALFVVNPYWFGFIAFNPFQASDAIALVCIGAGFLAIRRDRLLLFAVVAAVGAAAREPVVLLVPAAMVYVLAQEGWRWQPLARWLAAGVPAIGVFILVRILIPAPGPGLAEALINHADKAFEPATWYRLLVNSYAPVSLLPLVFWSTTRNFARRYPEFFVFGGLVLVSAFFGGDQERLMAPAFVAAYGLVGVILAWHLWPITWMRWVIGVAAFATSLHHLSARFPLPSRTATVVISLAALLAVTAAAIWIRVHSNPDQLRDDDSVAHT